MNHRVRGRASTKAGRNQYYPKLVKDNPTGHTLVTDEAGLSPYPDEQVLYEPTGPGFGAANRTMVIRTTRAAKTMVVSIGIGVIDVAWEDESIEFGNEEITFGD